MSRETLRTILSNPFVDTVSAVPLLIALALRGALQAIDDPWRVAWVGRLGWLAVVLLVVFLALVGARFAVVRS